MTAREYADVIKAWADGLPIQWKHWAQVEWQDTDQPDWNNTSLMFRVKPLVPDDIVRDIHINAIPSIDNAYNAPNVRVIFDGLTKKIKSVEII